MLWSGPSTILELSLNWPTLKWPSQHRRSEGGRREGQRRQGGDNDCREFPNRHCDQSRTGAGGGPAGLDQEAGGASERSSSATYREIMGGAATPPPTGSLGAGGAGVGAGVGSGVGAGVGSGWVPARGRRRRRCRRFHRLLPFPRPFSFCSRLPFFGRFDVRSDFCRGAGVFALQAIELGQAGGNFEFGAVAIDGGGHEGGPDRAGGRASEAGQFARVRVADPDRGRVERRVADEPGVGLVLGGSGLAGRGASSPCRCSRRRFLR